MDIFKQNRFLGSVIVLLVILNLMTLAMLWLGRPQRPAGRPAPAGQGRDQRRGEDQLQNVLRGELAFDDTQIEEYRQLTRRHREDVRRLNEEIRRTKQQMFEAVLEDSPKPELSGSLLALAQQKQAEIERSTFQYFLDLKNLCRPDQRGQLRAIIEDLFRQAPGRQGEDRPRPPAGREPPPRDDSRQPREDR